MAKVQTSLAALNRIERTTRKERERLRKREAEDQKFGGFIVGLALLTVCPWLLIPIAYLAAPVIMIVGLLAVIGTVWKALIQGRDLLRRRGILGPSTPTIAP